MKKNLSFDPTRKSSNSITRASLLKKYFPKYLNNFYLPTKHGSAKSKVKKIKIIRNSFISDSYYGPEWRPLLANKAKFIKTLDSHKQSRIQFLEMIKFFKYVTSIQLFLSTEPSTTPLRQRNDEGLVKVCNKMQCLNKLSSLKIDECSRHGLNLLQHLNSLPRFLSSLGNLALSYSHQYAFEAEMINLMESIPNLLKYVTSLNLGILCSPSHYEKFQSLPHSCPNLTELSFEFCGQVVFYNPMKSRRFSHHYFPVEINYLSALTSLNSLKALRLGIADIFTFLNDFVPPPGIQNLILNFQKILSKEVVLKIEKTFDEEKISQTFEENPTLLKLYSKFQHIQNLESLQILLSPDSHSEDYEYLNSLLRQILKRTPSLKKLTSNFTSRCCGLNRQSGFGSSIRDQHLPQFLESCQHFGQNLQTLEIGDGKITFSGFDLSSSRNKFPNLSRIIFRASFDNSDADIYSFLEQIISLGKSIRTIKLYTFVSNNVKSLLLLLKQLSRLQKPEKLEVKLRVEFFENKKLEEIGLAMGDVLAVFEEDHSILKGVSVKIVTYKTGSKPLEEFLKVYGKRFENFKIIHL